MIQNVKMLFGAPYVCNKVLKPEKFSRKGNEIFPHSIAITRYCIWRVCAFLNELSELTLAAPN